MEKYPSSKELGEEYASLVELEEEYASLVESSVASESNTIQSGRYSGEMVSPNTGKYILDLRIDKPK